VGTAQRRTAAPADGGFTLVELIVTMTIMSILLDLAFPAWRNYQANSDTVSAARTAVSLMRNAQVRAVSEEMTYRVDVNTSTKTLSVYRCVPGTAPLTCTLRQAKTLDGSTVRITSAAFTNSSGSSTTTAWFYARGTASPGTLVVQRTGRNTQHVVEVEGLTGRVSY
jgi:prepilin-type N-terminal cleavage/methylation domain-containing protein